MGDSIESLAKVKVNYSHFSSLVHKLSHFIIEGNQIGQARLTFGKSMLTAPNQLLLLHVLRNALLRGLTQCCWIAHLNSMNHLFYLFFNIVWTFLFSSGQGSPLLSFTFQKLKQEVF